MEIENVISTSSTRDEDDVVILIKRNSTAFNVALQTFSQKSQADILTFLQRIDKVIKIYINFEK
jgi:hypothetical protein